VTGTGEEERDGRGGKGRGRREDMKGEETGKEGEISPHGHF